MLKRRKHYGFPGRCGSLLAAIVLLPRAIAFYGRIENPSPTITAIVPARIAAVSAGQMLAIDGRNFLSNSTIMFNGVTRSSTFVSSNRLTIGLRSPELSVPATFFIVVINPPPGGGNSANASLVVQPANAK